jgi:condensin complex subunit 3
VERLVRFVVVLANERDADEAEDDAFLEELLWALLPLAGAADRGVRFRVCQLIASLLHGLSNDTGLADELYVELVAAMTERLRDRAPAARMQAARALARLQARCALQKRKGLRAALPSP